MSAIGLRGTALGWLGRQGPRAIAVVGFIGIAAPSLDALVKPFVPEAIFALLCIAFLRVETAALRARLGRPGLLVAVTAWTMLVIPAMVNRAGRRGRAISSLLMAETLGLLVGSASGGSLYTHSGSASPFVVEAGCMLIGVVVVGWFGLPGSTPPVAKAATSQRGPLGDLIAVPGFVLMCCTNAAVMAIQTGVIVFLYPLYLVERGALSPQAVGHLIALSVLGRLLALWLAGRLSDRRSRISMLALGLPGFGIAPGTCIFAIGTLRLAAWSVTLLAASG